MKGTLKKFFVLVLCLYSLGQLYPLGKEVFFLSADLPNIVHDFILKKCLTS